MSRSIRIYICNVWSAISFWLYKLFNENTLHFRRARTRERKVQIHLRRFGSHLHRADREELIDNRRSYVSNGCRNNWPIDNKHGTLSWPLCKTGHFAYAVIIIIIITLVSEKLLHIWNKYFPSRSIPSFRSVFFFSFFLSSFSILFDRYLIFHLFSLFFFFL